jgi:hypothetical protein
LSRNKDRLGRKKEVAASDPVATSALVGGDSPLIFETPSEFVELPTRGIFYPEGHPLYNKEHIEIKHMTAKEEDILSSKSLLKKGLALDRFMQSVIKDKAIKVEDLYVGDRNAILIAARVTGYGDDYTTQVTCPNCLTVNKFTFDLTQQTITEGGLSGESEVKITPTGTLLLALPIMGLDVEVRMLTGKAESYLTRLATNKSKDSVDSSLTDMLKMIIVSVSGRTDRSTIESLVEHLPAKDSQYLRNTYAECLPNISLKQAFECSSCTYEDEMEVPLNAEFFWPK